MIRASGLSTLGSRKCGDKISATNASGDNIKGVSARGDKICNSHQFYKHWYYLTQKALLDSHLKYHFISVLVINENPCCN